MPIQLIAFMVAVFALCCFVAAAWVLFIALSVEGTTRKRVSALVGGLLVYGILFHHGDLAGTYAGKLYSKMLRDSGW